VLPTSNGFAVVSLDFVEQGKLQDGALLAGQQYERLLANSSASHEAYGLIRQLRHYADVKVYEDRIK